ncbi:putative ABC-type transport system, periplasmic component/surface lipoprotein [Mesorhizobium australicum WSM2073]|uniref:Putative ABC-type transport system, periplasmic component/surface lipoprotein n=1 Tax=Mesorhizobium australicum (strain HAMBI 3006 / LMG 24608 / WSM2073) TaxID=754035 RepID=L0KK06_MESAW|nr:BMP family protein [Mesorhizobium australicum]AGB44885.1 putative ABC-type transport system, periplasmic component/surface lipoprotein [Mesorhizobium australicum WSM2073]
MKKTAISRRSLLASVLGLTLAGFWPGFAHADDFKMGLLVPGSVSEEGWNRIGYNALKGVEQQLGAKISYVELQQNPASFEKAFRDYASQGYKVILGHGFEFQDAALEVAPDYPDTYFLISSSAIHEGNVIGLNTDTSQPFYLMGVIAAKMGHKAGLVGGMEIPPIQQAFAGFKNGAKSINPAFPISEVYIGNFTDTTATKEAALSMISQGADFVLPNASGATVGGYQAIAESGPNVRSFSIFSDFTQVAPNNILGLYVADYAQGVVEVVRSIRAGNPPKENVVFGLKDPKVISFAFRDDGPVSVPADVRTEVKAISDKIAAGQIKTDGN